METWITHLNTPLVLIGFMLFIVAGIIKFLLQNNLIKVNQVNSAKLINKTLNYLFILALAGMTYGFLSQEKVLQSIPKTELKPAVPTKQPTSIKQLIDGDKNKVETKNVDLTGKNIEQNVKGNRNRVNAEGKK